MSCRSKLGVDWLSVKEELYRNIVVNFRVFSRVKVVPNLCKRHDSFDLLEFTLNEGLSILRRLD